MTDYKFDKYTECGTKIDLNFAIDFTISNGNYKRKEVSLHSLDPSKNTYIRVISDVYRVFKEFAYLQNTQAKMLGFGAK